MTDYAQWQQDRQLLEQYKRALQEINNGGIKIAINALTNPVDETICPYCGEKDSIVKDFEDNHGIVYYSIYCGSCLTTSSWHNAHRNALDEWKRGFCKMGRKMENKYFITEDNLLYNHKIKSLIKENITLAKETQELRLKLKETNDAIKSAVTKLRSHHSSRPGIKVIADKLEEVLT